jgi:hypothetical protein
MSQHALATDRANSLVAIPDAPPLLKRVSMRLDRSTAFPREAALSFRRP